MVAFAGVGTVKTTSMQLFPKLEAHDHHESVTAEGFQEKFLVIDFDLTVDLPKEAILVFFADLVLELFILLFTEPFATESNFFLGT